jgi:hypothetical protein
MKTGKHGSMSKKSKSSKPKASKHTYRKGKSMGKGMGSKKGY